MTDSPLLSVAARELLYRTRGRDWDYAFLLQPEPLLSEGWYALHRRIFTNVEPDEAPLLLRGTLGIGTGHPFFATAFTDAVRRDSQSRPIAHYIVWLGQAAEAAPALSFGPGLVAALAPALASVFDWAPQRPTAGETKPLDAQLRARFVSSLPGPALNVATSAGAALRWLGTIAP